MLSVLLSEIVKAFLALHFHHRNLTSLHLKDLKGSILLDKECLGLEITKEKTIDLCNQV